MVAAGFLSLSEWSITICLTQYNHIKNVLSVSLNKTFPSFLLKNRSSQCFTTGVTKAVILSVG